MNKKALKNIDNLKLNLGCEDKILPGFINVDIIKKKGIVNVDLNKYPLPFKNNSCKYILASHLLEHLKNPTKFMLELHRISKKDAITDLYVPHYSFCATYADLTHVKPGFSYLTFGNPNWNKEINRKFEVVSKKLNFTRSNAKFLNGIFNPLINLSPILYERFFANILPCSEIHFRLRTIK